ncbi:hypothetical protein ACFLYR_05805 [Chloroflexota bacterium]
MAKSECTILQYWPVLCEDFKKFISDRPGWFISALENARRKKGKKGWEDVETLTNILQFLKDTEVEY